MSVSKLVEKIDADVFLESLSKLDPALKDILSSSIGGDLIEKIVIKYEVDLFHLPDLMMLFGLYVTKLIPPQQFIDYLAVFVPQKYFSQFLQELEDKLWSPYDVYLNKAGVVYKQLTKLTPAPMAEEPTGAELSIKNKELSGEESQQVQDSGLKIEESKINIPAVQVEPPKVPEQVQQITDNLKPTTETDIKQQKTNGVVIPELPETPKPSKPMVISDTPATFNVVSAPGEKRVVEAPKPDYPTSGIRPPISEGVARVKFDAPRVGPQIFKPTESAITPKASEVKFVGPEIKPEVSGNVPPASSQWQRPEEKKVEIPKPPEVKKTEVSGRQVIDLTNFGLSQPDKAE